MTMTIASLILQIHLLTAQISILRAELSIQQVEQIDFTPYYIAQNLE